MEIQPLEYGAFLSAMTSKTNAPGYLMGNGHTNPTTTIRKSFVKGQVWNPSQWNDPEYDKKMDAVYLEQDETKRQAMLKEMTREILDKAPYIWLPTPYIFTAWWPWVKNYGGELRAGAVRPGPDLRPHLDRPGAEKEDGLLSGESGDDAPAAGSQKPDDAVPHRTRHRDRGRRRLVPCRSRRNARHRRRVRVRKKRHRVVGAAADPEPAGPDRERRNPVRRRRSPEARRSRHPRGARQQDRDDLPGADVLAQSGADRRPAGGGADQRASGHAMGQSLRSRYRTDRPRAYCGRGEQARLLSAPVFRRHAPARHDRDGAGLRSRA